MLKQWERGLDGPTIAKKLGLGTSTVYRALRAKGIDPAAAPARPKRDPRRKHTIEQEQEICRRYAAGESLASVAKDFDCDWNTIKAVVLRNGGEMRPAGGRFRETTDDEVAEIVRRYNAGESQADIAFSLGTSQVWVSRLLRMRGEVPADWRRKAAWKGGRVEGDYIQIWVGADEPMAEMRNSMGYVAEHRLVMAGALGRPLTRQETVHHIDGDHHHNDLGNLQLRQGNHGKGAWFVCGDCGSHNVIAQALPEEEP